MEQIFGYIDQNADRFIKELSELVNQPTISAQQVGIEETAELLKARMTRVGIKTRIIPIEGGNPVVYGEIEGEGSKTLMFYDHYDVQPPEPIEEWESDPFNAKIRNGKIYARGVSDNKGNIVARIKAVEAFLKVRRKLPLNVKFVIEGEEEIGSPNLARFVEQNKELLKADACIWEGGPKDWLDCPTVYLGLKGLCYVELGVKGAKKDQHSSMATIIPNPAWRLVHALDTLKDDRENILIKGFYEGVEEPTREEEKLLGKIHLPEEKIKTELEIKDFLLELKGLDLVKRHLYQPTCTICGLGAGYQGKGAKTVLPREAKAKVGFRLVPNQNPFDIFKKLKKHLKNKGYSDIEVKLLGAEEPSKTPVGSEIANVVRDTAKESYGKDPVVYPINPGSGPMYLFQKLGLSIASAGVGWTGSNGHAPNENIRIGDFIEGIKHVALILQKFGP
ncbi:MAG TPA: M20/M25/M40 family metallo-hydrolase [Thermoplasmata archaeon]|nr:M20/M25/M40 family metallo-hydrolase [Thermoplasmata archaeon]